MFDMNNHKNNNLIIQQILNHFLFLKMKVNE
jgi:hypothetical protein